MASPPAVSAGMYYHIFNRGINGALLFPEARNFPYFQDLYCLHIKPVADTFAWCLLPDHFHLLVWIRPGAQQGSASRGFSNLFNAYAKAINRAGSRYGSLFPHPFGRRPILDRMQLWRTITYIHQNPQKHGVVDDFRKWMFSSYQEYLSANPLIIPGGALGEWFSDRVNFVNINSDWVEDACARCLQDV